MVTLAIWGAVSPGAILTKCRVWALWGDMVDVITCAIFGDCRLRGVDVVRGASLPYPITRSHGSVTSVVRATRQVKGASGGNQQLPHFILGPLPYLSN